MAEEPSLPVLPVPVFPWNQSLVPSNGKKRVRLQGTVDPPPPMITNSSDPAVFSSDDDPSLENYSAGRKKRRLVGSWYEQQPASSDPIVGDDVLVPNPRPVRKFARHFDSGVYTSMPDGNSDTFTDEESASPPAAPPQPRQRQFCRQVSQVSTAERIARDKIQACIETGRDTIDLSDLGLSEISSGTIEPLRALAHIPVVEKGIYFETPELELKVFLAKNSLRSLPGALFDLGNITTLSLRQTGLRKLPDGIGRLKKLKDLNLMSNRLRCLPSSLLELLGAPGSLSHLRCLGNSNLLFLEHGRCDTPGETAGEEAQPIVSAESLAAWKKLPAAAGAVFVARSPVEICDTVGRPQSDFILANLLESKRAQIVADGTVLSPPTSSQSGARCRAKPRQTRVPSLLELALRKCYESASLAELPQYLPPDVVPSIHALLRQAITQREEGGRRCSTCAKAFVCPRTKWIEWWRLTGDNHISPAEEDGCYHDVLPFLHMGCSTACLPRRIDFGTTLEDWRSRQATKSE